MSENFPMKDGNGNIVFSKSSGTGTDLDPWIFHHIIEDGGGTITVDGPVTDEQLRATPLPVSGTFYPDTQPVSGPLTNAQLRELAVLISGTVTANAGTNLNTSLLALEAGGNLAAIKDDVDKIPPQGQALASASMPVVLPQDQITTLTPPAAITNFANETGGNLSSIKSNTDKIPSLGQATKAGSVPVAIASDQGSLPVTDSSVAGLSKNSGVTDAGTLRVITASDGPLNQAIGQKTDAEVASGDASEIALLKRLRTLETSIAAYAPIGSHSSGASISTAQTLTKPAGASQIMIQALTQNVRYTLDGTDPTASLGFQLLAGNPPVIIAVPGASIKVIQETATASLQYQWIS